MKAAGAKRALPLKVGGAFHSPLMNPAKVELEAAINATEFHTPKCPVYQNVDALPHTDPAEIKKNLVAQLTASVRWTQQSRIWLPMVPPTLRNAVRCSTARTYQENRRQCIGSRHCITGKKQLNAKGGLSKKTIVPFSFFQDILMSKSEEFRKALDVPIRNLSVDVLVREICHQPECFEAMYRLMSDEKQSVAWRATWVCEKLSEIHPAWFIPLYDDLVYRLSDCKHQGSKRLLLSILYNLPVTAPVSVELLNYSLDHMLSLQESIGVQSLSIRMAYRLCKHEPELLSELKLILEHANTEFYSTGVKTAIRNILKKIKK